MTVNFSFNKIYILESLSNTEIQTGKNIYNDLLRWKTLNNDSLYSEYFDIENKSQFAQTLSAINSQVQNGFYPFVHFEIHGSKNKDGLILKSGELIKWEQLSKFSRAINISTKNNLIISLATCYGAYFITSININKVAPFSCCISTIDEISSGEIEVDFRSFFETILNTTNFNLAVENLNKSNKNPNKYHFFSAEEFLEMVLNKLDKEDFNEKTIEHRKWVSSLCKQLRDQSAEYAQLKKKSVKELVRKHLRNQKSDLRLGLRQSFLTFDT